MASPVFVVSVRPIARDGGDHPRPEDPLRPLDGAGS